MTPNDLPALPTRHPNAHKGEAGRVLCVAGSAGMSGAAALTGRACLRSGAGLVTVATTKPAAKAIAALDPNLITRTLPTHDAGGLSRKASDRVLTLAVNARSVVVGPGLGQADLNALVIPEIIARLSGPTVVDADGLNLLARNLDTLQSRDAGEVVLTPHAGEMARLLGGTDDDLNDDPTARKQAAESFAQQHRVIVVLKGTGTVVTDGTRTFVNTTGNPSMAKAGTGDVLSGVIGGLLAQGMNPFDASALGVYLHGLAGDRLAERMGVWGVLATDLVDELPMAFKQYQGEA